MKAGRHVRTLRTQYHTWREVHDLYGLTGAGRNLQAHYNIAPTDTVDVVRPGAKNAPLPTLVLARPCSLGQRLRAGRDQRIVRRVADATRCGTFGRKDGRDPGRAAIGHEQHLIVAAQRRAGLWGFVARPLPQWLRSAKMSRDPDPAISQLGVASFGQYTI